jgi:hypothetical protein
MHRPRKPGNRPTSSDRFVWMAVALALAAGGLGCRSSGQLRLRVDEAAYGRLPEKLRATVAENAGRELEAAREEHKHLVEAEAKVRQHLASSEPEQRVAVEATQRAQAQVREAHQGKDAARLEQVNRELRLAEASQAVTAAKRTWLQADLHFQEAVSMAGHRHVLALEAQLERVKAELLVEANGKGRTERFQAQYDDLHKAWRAATRDIAPVRAESDRQLHLLNEAKARYAALRTGTAPVPATAATPAPAAAPPAATAPVAAPATTTASPAAAVAAPAAAPSSASRPPAKTSASTSPRSGATPARTAPAGSKAAH